MDQSSLEILYKFGEEVPLKSLSDLLRPTGTPISALTLRKQFVVTEPREKVRKK